jgi:hypothetical protein
LPLLIGRSTGSLVMWQRVGGRHGEHDEFGVESVLVGLGAGQGQHGSVGMFGELVRVSAASSLRAARRRTPPAQDAVAQAGQIGAARGGSSKS